MGLLSLVIFFGVWTLSISTQTDDLIHKLEAKVKLLEQQQNEDRAIIRGFLSITPTVPAVTSSYDHETDLVEIRETLTKLVREKKHSEDLSDVVKDLKVENENLRTDILRLKSDVERLKERKEEASAVHQQAVAVRWLQKSVERIRGEIAEVAAAQNVSAALRQQQRVDAQLGLIHADITWLRADAEQQRAQQEKLAAGVKQVESDVEEVREQENRFSDRWQKLKEELLKLQDEVKRIKTTSPSPNVEMEDNNLHQWPVRMRHERRLRKTLNRLTVAQERFDHELNLLRHNQTGFATETRRLNKQIGHLRNESAAQWKSKFAVIDAMRIRLSSVELVTAHMSVAIHNVTTSSSTLEKLHASTVQLFEALESVESTCVNGIGTLRRELSKMEFNVAQITSALTILKEDENAYEHTLQIPQHASQHAHKGGKRHRDQSKDSIQNEDKKFALVDDIFEEDEKKIFPRDCSEISSLHDGTSIYSIKPNEKFNTTIDAVCELDSNDNTWTIIQRHFDVTQDFDRTWDEYSTGFGNLVSNLWLGNEAIHAITSEKPHMLHIDLWDSDGQYRYADYETFAVSSKENNYKLNVGGYRGNASDAFRLHTGAAFSTKDVDNDSSATHCAQLYSGGWWYARCQYVNLNSNMDSGFVWFDVNNNLWIPLSRVQMKIRVRD